MKVEIKVPNFGESISEAVVSQIIKPTGTFVKKDEDIVELETEKVNQVIHSPEEGQLTLSVKTDDKVGIGDVIGFVETDVKAPTETKAKEVLPSKPPKKEKEKAEEKKPEEPKALPSKAPDVRRMPEEFIASLEKEEEKPKEVSTLSKSSLDHGQTRKRMSGLRRTIAKRLVDVKNMTAMLTTFNEIDMSQVIAIRNKEKENFLKKFGVRLGFMSFFAKGCVSALKAYPDVNAFIEGDEIVYNHDYHLGIAVSTDRGLFVPVVRNCDKISYADIERQIGDFAKKAKEGTISIEDLKGGTFTLTNGGVFGSLLSTPILNPPQSGILGMHSIVKRPVVIDDQIQIRPMMYVALSYDHRIVDGREAVSFLVHLKENLEDPARFLLED